MKLNFKNVTRKEKVDETNNEPTASGFKLQLTQGKQYDLDEIIASKRRDNDSASILLKVDINSNDSNLAIQHIAKMVLSENEIPYTEDNFKTQVQLVPDFIAQFERMLEKYYPIYSKNVNQLTNGSISINTVLETISFAYTDYAAYLASSDARVEVTGPYVNTSLINNKAIVNITEGSQENETSNIIPFSSFNLSKPYSRYPKNELTEGTIIYFPKEVISPNETVYSKGLYIYSKIESYDARKYNDGTLGDIKIPDNFIDRAYLGFISHIKGSVDNINIPNDVEIDLNEQLFIKIYNNDEVIASKEIQFADGLIDEYICFANGLVELFIEDTYINIESIEGYRIGTIGFDALELYDITSKVSDDNQSSIINDYLANEGYCLTLIM